jgi:hypothetical protein
MGLDNLLTRKVVAQGILTRVNAGGPNILMYIEFGSFLCNSLAEMHLLSPATMHVGGLCLPDEPFDSLAEAKLL